MKNRLLPTVRGAALTGTVLLALACPTLGLAQMGGGVLTGPNGMTVYTLDRDVAGSGKSMCAGQCATMWPPVAAPADGKMPGADYSVIMRDDGAQQLAYKGKPLYYWSKDTKPGDMGGDGMRDVWHAAKP